MNTEDRDILKILWKREEIARLEGEILKILWKREGRNCSLRERYIENIVEKRRNCSLREQFLFFSKIFCYLLLDFHVKTGTSFNFEIGGDSR